MHLPIYTTLCFSFLAISVGALWLPKIGNQSGIAISPWILFFGLALGLGMWIGLVRPIGALALGGLTISGWCARSWEGKRWIGAVFWVLTLLLALALAIHKIPGFNNPILIQDTHLSERSSGLTQYLNFDKTAVGIILLAIFCQPCSQLKSWKTWLPGTTAIIASCLVSVLGVAWYLHFVTIDPKFSILIVTLLAIQLLSTCVAEEAFFRGLVQTRLGACIGKSRAGQILVIVISGAIFGLSHYAGGYIYVLLATLAGWHYAAAYHASKRIEAAILTHFVLNATHMIAFTYPHV